MASSGNDFSHYSANPHIGQRKEWVAIHKKYTGILLCLLLLLGLLLSACSSFSAPVSGLELWYAETDPGAEQLLSLTAAFNSRDAGIKVKLRGFSSEEALSEALVLSRPDLVYCSHYVYSALKETGATGSASIATSPSSLFTDSALSFDADVGSSYFPLGADVQPFFSGTEISAGSFHELLATAGSRNGVYSLSCDSYAVLFRSLLLSDGEAFSADPDRLGSNALQLQQLLSRAVFDGILYPGLLSDPAVLTEVPTLCMILHSSSAAGAPSALYASPIPALNGSQLQDTAVMYGLVVLSGAEAASSSSFLQFLSGSGAFTASALAAGLVPAGRNARGDGSSLQSALIELADTHSLSFPAAEDAWRMNCARFDSCFSTSLQSLS